eukprot:180851_1
MWKQTIKFVMILLMLYYIYCIDNVQSQVIKSETYQLSYCVIRKAASSKMQRLMYSIILNQDDKRCTRSECALSGSKINLEHIRNMTHSKHVMDQLLNNSTWTNMVIIRDPLERLLSGYLHWCVLNTKNEKQCPKDVRQAKSFKLFVDKIYNFYLDVQKNKSINMCHINVHRRPAVCICNLKKMYNKFNAKLFYTYDSIGDQVLNVLQQKGLQRFYYGYGDSHNETLFQKGFHVTNAGEKVKQYFSKDIIKKAMEIYEEDYRMFQIEYPQWALSIVNNKTNQINQTMHIDTIYDNYLTTNLISSDINLMCLVGLLFIIWICYRAIIVPCINLVH